MTTARRIPFVHPPPPPPPVQLLNTSAEQPAVPSPPLPASNVRRYALHAGRCVADCPSGHQRDTETGHCLPCGDKCPRLRKFFGHIITVMPRVLTLSFAPNIPYPSFALSVSACHHLLINSLKSLSKLKDCYSVTDLYISIHEGDPGTSTTVSRIALVEKQNCSSLLLQPS